ncbi:MAG: plasmid pRiA4b ORF-3 family protein, partial [Burkholderiales bacterium]
MPAIRLPALHRVFQAALGWTDSHLHEFIINGRRYAEPNPDWNEELKQQDERRVVLADALGSEARTFEYVYDFGDHWHHAVVVEDCIVQP